jgi:hypothetical protein
MSAPSEPNVVELIVHGVSGTPPEAVLRCPIEEIDLVGGDKSAGFYRRRPEERPPGQTRITEAFSWGGLTSGPASRALWLLFLPFILINLAHWMLPPPKDKRLIAQLSISTLRLLGLSLTLTILLASVTVAMDMIGWQCAGLAQCSEGLGPAKVLAGLPTRGAQLAITALPIALMVAALWLFGRSQARPGMPPNPAVVEGDVAPLAQKAFWDRDKSVDRLRACHIAAWLSGLALVTLIAPHQYSSGQTRTIFGVLLVVNAVPFAIAVIATMLNKVTARGGRGPSEAVARWTLRKLWVPSLVLLAGTLAAVWFFPAEYPNLDLAGDQLVTPTVLPGLSTVISWLIVVQIGLLAVLFVLVAFSSRSSSDRDYRPTIRGFTGFFVALMAWLIGGGLSVGLGLWVARFLGDPVNSDTAAQCRIGIRERILETGYARTADLTNLCNGQTLPGVPATFQQKTSALAEQAPLILPTPYYAAAVANIVLIIVVVITAGILFFAIARRARKRWTELGTEYGEPVAEGQRNFKFMKKIGRTQEWAAVPDWAPWLLAGLLIFASVDIAVFYPLLKGVPSYQRINFLITLSQAITAFLAATFVGLVVAAFRNRDTRRSIAVLWDVVTFWPQATHPLGPPCYGERAVPDLRDRVSRLTVGEKNKVILSAHSQGSIISAAVLLQTTTQTPAVAATKPTAPEADVKASRIPEASQQSMSQPLAFLTYGAPLRKLYARNFPAYFGREVLESLEPKETGQWLNLWAPTDPIGGFVFVKNAEATPITAQSLQIVDCRLHDVQLEELRYGKAPICGHSGFRIRPEYKAAIDVLQSKLG